MSGYVSLTLPPNASDTSFPLFIVRLRTPTPSTPSFRIDEQHHRPDQLRRERERQRGVRRAFYGFEQLRPRLQLRRRRLVRDGANGLIHQGLVLDEERGECAEACEEWGDECEHRQLGACRSTLLFLS